MKIRGTKPLALDDAPTGVLFIVPRLHTNMRGWLGALIAKGLPVRVLAITTGLTEDHSWVEPNPFVASRRAKQKIARRLAEEPETPPEEIAVKEFFPSFRELLNNVRSFPFDTAVVRGPLRWVVPVLVLLRLLYPRSRLRFYHQRPLAPPVSQKQYKAVVKEWALRFLIGFFGATPVSPILARHALTDDEFATKQDVHSDRFMPFLLGPAKNFRQSKSSNKLRILVVGKFRAYKSYDVLDRALHLLDQPMRQKIDLIIAGQAKLDSELEYYRALRKDLSDVAGLGSLTILANVEPAQMDTYYRWASCTLLTSRYEVAAISPIEGMGHGAFPLATSENGTNCYFHDGKSGLIFEAGSAESLAEKLTWLLSNPTLWESLGLTSKAVIHERASERQFFKSLGAKYSSRTA